MANTAAKPATPKSNSPAPTTTNHTEALSKAIGARITLTTLPPHSQTYTGTLFTACATLNLLALNTSASPDPASASDSGDYHLIPIPRVQSFHIAHPAPAQTPPLAPVDTRRLAAREASRVAALKEAAAHRGKGVGAEAQAIYDALKRVNIPIRWHNAEMIVHEAVIVSPPYRPEDCKGSAAKVAVLNQVKKVLEGERRKLSQKGEVRKGG
ncbi:hypothetical protein WHR41_00735 [Cladosporium halotolerans]|uniref:AD domain-containing protein n=1 Tax=Cladosporium halotolerans TaxID=1052096 RepID=A0AB34L0B4_9PEZI